MRKPTERQLNFIKVIENEWGFGKFEGNTFEEAKTYIAECMEEQRREKLERECFNYGAPNE